MRVGKSGILCLPLSLSGGGDPTTVFFFLSEGEDKEKMKLAVEFVFQAKRRGLFSCDRSDHLAYRLSIETFCL